MSLKRAGGLVGGIAVALLACQQANPPVVKQQTFSAAPGALDRVAVIPFYPRPQLSDSLAPGGATAEEVAGFVGAFFTDALSQQGVRVVAPSDVAAAFTNRGHATPRRDPQFAGQFTKTEFGATSVVMGEVYRWRDRAGEALGADRPASVGYEVSLFDVNTGRRLWNSRFDHTQRTLTGDPLTARKYPGGGTRWLTAAELARWGANAAARSLVEGQWRASK